MLHFFFSAASSLSQNNVNYFAVNEAYSPLAILDLLEATMQVYHNYRLYESGTFENDTYNFTTGVVLVTVTDDELNGPDVFPPNRLKPAYSMQGKLRIIIRADRQFSSVITNSYDRNVPIGNHIMCPKKKIGTSRHLKVPDFVYKRAIQLLRGADELTIGAVVRQERANTGSIVSFSLESNRYSLNGKKKRRTLISGPLDLDTWNWSRAGAKTRWGCTTFPKAAAVSTPRFSRTLWPTAVGTPWP